MTKAMNMKQAAEQLSKYLNEKYGVPLDDDLTDFFHDAELTPSAEPQQAVAWLIIHDVGHDLIEKEVVFQPVDGAIPLCVCSDKK